MNKTAVVTGATSGIGLSAAKQLAEKGINVIGIGRDKERCQKARDVIAEAARDCEVHFIVEDLSTTGHVHSAAVQIKELLKQKGWNVDILMNVCGTVSSWYVSTAEGYELQFAVNHLAPFLLTHELLPYLNKDESRVLAVSSESHYRTRVRWKDIMMRRHYSCLAAYKQSKLCNVLFIAELSRRLRETNTSTYAIDPGLANTEIGLKGTSGIEKLVWKFRQKSGTSPDVPARHMVDIATLPEYRGKSGLYWKNGKEKTPSSVARNPEQAAKLWELSVKLCGIASDL